MTQADLANRAISIHALLAESDGCDIVSIECCSLFLSTLSLRRATSRASRLRRLSEFLSTLSLRRATITSKLCNLLINISIHALLAESDRFDASRPCKPCDFYPRSPCGERQGLPAGQPITPDFYPRSPCGERLRPAFRPCEANNFYPRSPCGERPDELGTRLCDYCISIHALLAESDKADSPTKWTAT